MQEIVLDFTGCKYFYGVHKVLKEAFEFPEWYGMNLDALWDLLYNYCDWELHVYIKGLNKLPNELNDYMREILKIFEDVHSETPNIVFEIVS